MSEPTKNNNLFVSLLALGLLIVVGYMLYVNFSQSSLKEQSAVAGCHIMQPDPSVATIDVELTLKDGPVVLELRQDLAPQHVERIITLAKQGFYDGIVFHRVIDGFMAQTGDPTGTGMGGSELPDLPCEFSNETFAEGVVGMARSQNPNSANSQFFITFADASFLDKQYTVLGKVKSGMEFVHMIKKGAGQNGQVTDPDKIVSMRVLSGQ